MFQSAPESGRKRKREGKRRGRKGGEKKGRKKEEVFPDLVHWQMPVAVVVVGRPNLNF